MEYDYRVIPRLGLLITGYTINMDNLFFFFFKQNLLLYRLTKLHLPTSALEFSYFSSINFLSTSLPPNRIS